MITTYHRSYAPRLKKYNFKEVCLPIKQNTQFACSYNQNGHAQTNIPAQRVMIFQNLIEPTLLISLTTLPHCDQSRYHTLLVQLQL